MIVVLGTARPRNLFIMAALANVSERWQRKTVVTVGANGKHMQGSKHGVGDALDIRSNRGFKDLIEKERFLLEVLERLGPGYQGFIEDQGKPNEHFHIEWDPL